MILLIKREREKWVSSCKDGFSDKSMASLNIDVRTVVTDQ